MKLIALKNSWNPFTLLLLAWAFFCHLLVQFLSRRNYFYTSIAFISLLMKVSRILVILFLKNFNYKKCYSKRLKLGLGDPTSKTICEKTNKLVEKWCKIGFFVLKYVISSCFIFPKAIISFLIYFTTDLGNDSFDLPLPMW